MEKKPLKRPVFHSSFEEQKSYSQQNALNMNVAERLAEMYRLNRKIYGESYGKISKTVEVFVGLPGETVNEFYKRINNNG